MATYKVIQDVEAEDKILGPLSLKQLIYASISAGFVFLGFRVVTLAGSIYLAIPFVPFVLVFGALAAPLSKDQTTEMWLAAMIRFYTKPRKRIWDQDGMKELVQITVPKKIEKHYTDGLNQNQVRSRLHALASTMDSRGWAVKNADYATVLQYNSQNSDRLISTNNLPQINNKPTDEATDIMDINSSPVAQHFDKMMQKSSQDRRSEAIAKMNTPLPKAPPANTDNTKNDNDYWFMHQTTPSQPRKAGEAIFNETVVHPGANDDPTIALKANDQNLTPEEQQIIKNAKEKKKVDVFANYTHHKVVLTSAQLDQQAKELAQKQRELDAKRRLQQEQKQAKTRLQDDDRIRLAQAKDLKVSTIAGLAQHKTKEDPEEVVINLH
jgi:hypothetical protein